MQFAFRFPVLFLPVTGLLFCGCSTVIDSHAQKAPTVAAWQAGNYPRTAELLESKVNSTRGSGDELMWQLENGLFQFCRGKFDDALRCFNAAERLMRDYDERAVVSVRDAGAETGSALLNPNVLPYKGYTRDRILVPFYRALAYLGKRSEQGFHVELQRMREAQKNAASRHAKNIEEEKRKLAAEQEKGRTGIDESRIVADPNYRAATKELYESARRAYGNYLNPVAVFLSAIGYLRRGDLENACVDFRRLYEALPSEPFIQQCYATLLRRTGRAVPELLKNVVPLSADMGRGMVYVIFANGRGAAFRQIKINLLVTGFAFPVCEYYPVPFSGLRISGGGRETVTFRLADMDAILSQEHAELLPIRITRIVVSYAVKEAATAAAVALAWNADPLAGALTLAGTSLYKQVFNTADTRNWEFLPKEFQFAGIPMPEDRMVRIVPFLPAGVLETGFRVAFSPGCTAALLYIQAQSGKAIQYQIFEFQP